MSREVLKVDNARIIFHNFAGAADKFNREGDRNFSIAIDDPEEAQRLVAAGWNVKIKPPREEGDTPFMSLKVNVKFGDYPPTIYLVSNGEMRKLDEDTVGMLDDIEIENVDMDITPYDWGPIGQEQKYGRTAYLQAMCVTQRVDRFAARFARRGDDING